MEQVLRNVVVSVVFAVLGFGLLFLGYKTFDRLTPTSLSRQIFEDRNVAAAVLAGAFVIGLAIVVAAAIS
jgi:putative membrane protein